MSCLSSREFPDCITMLRRKAVALLAAASFSFCLMMPASGAEKSTGSPEVVRAESAAPSRPEQAAPAARGEKNASAAPDDGTSPAHPAATAPAGAMQPAAGSPAVRSPVAGEKQKSSSGNFSINRTEGSTVGDAAAGSELFSFPGVEESRQKLPPAASIIFHKLRKPYVFAEFRQISSPGSVRKESSGYLKIDGSVICFLVEKPVPITYRIDSALSTFIITIDGRRSEERLLDQQTMNGLFIKAVASIFTGDLDFAWKVFRLSAHSEKGDWWTFVIEPSEDDFKSLSGPIRFYGSAYLNTIESVDANDGHMISTISFTKHSEKRDDEPEALQTGCR